MLETKQFLHPGNRNRWQVPPFLVQISSSSMAVEWDFVRRRFLFSQCPASPLTRPSC